MYRSPKADLIRAFKVLEPDKTDHATRQAMAQLLGLAWKSHVDEPVPVESTTPGSEPASATEGSQPPGPPVTSEVPPPSDDPIRFQLIAKQLGRRSTPVWVEQVEPFPAARSGSKSPLPPLEPLFRPDWTRGILTGALSRVRPDGPIDIPRIIERICRGEAVRQLLRVELSTLARGVQLLVDQSEAMMPFRRDQKWLVEQLERIAGKHAFEFRNFIGCPSRAMGSGPRVDWKPYRNWAAPRAGTTIVVVTDLGITSAPMRHPKARLEEWLDFAGLVRAQACPIVALVPFKPDRVPAPLHRVLTVIHWDRSTTASRVRSVVGKGLR